MPLNTEKVARRVCNSLIFDIIIKDDLIKKRDDNSLLALRLYYERFSRNKTENTPKIILKNLIKIAKNHKPYQQ